MSEQLPPGPREIRLRYAGRCEGCAADLTKGTEACRRLAKLEADVDADTAWRAEVKAAHPILGRVAAAVTAKPTVGPEPQHVKAWTVGADGEQKVGHRLEDWASAGENRVVLHDRRIHGTRANIDHLAICPAGVWVIDAREFAARSSTSTQAQSSALTGSFGSAAGTDPSWPAVSNGK